MIPAYNEAERIGATLRALKQLSLPQPYEVIVIDDGSVDETARIAREQGADRILTQPNKGKGAALNFGFMESKGDLLLLLDADIGTTAAEALKLLQPVLEDKADMTIATFPIRKNKGGGFGFVVGLARWGIRKYTGRAMSAPLSGQRALKRAVVEQCGGFAEHWGVEIALTILALRNGFRVEEVPTEMTHRVTGRKLKDILHRIAQFRSVAMTLLRLPKHSSFHKKAGGA